VNWWLKICFPRPHSSHVTRHFLYCSSLTCSIQSTTFPLSASWIATCVIAVVGVAPCQCFSLGSNQTTSPGLISSTCPPSRCAHPRPAVTINVWPNGCVCHAVRAPGSNVTLAPRTRAGSGASNNGSIRTLPVNQSAGPLFEGCDPFLLSYMISNVVAARFSLNSLKERGSNGALRSQLLLQLFSVSVLKLVRCPRSLAPTLVTLPSMSLFPFAPFSFSATAPT